MHICFEGIDGTGKTTLSLAVKNELEKQGKKVFHTSEPGNKNQQCSMSIRDLILNNDYCEEIDDTDREYLLALNRKIQYKRSKKELDVGTIVVQDRGWLSGFAYSQAKGFSHDEIYSLNEKLNPNFIQMFDYIIYLNNNRNVEETLKKAQEAKSEFSTGDTIESKGASFQQEVRDNYVQLVNKYQDRVNIVLINIYEDDKRLSTEELVSKVMDIIKKKILMFVGNSGSGKSTLEKKLVEEYPHLFSKVISFTTREKRDGEVDGDTYHYISDETFDSLLDKNEFIQTTLYGNNKYASSYKSYFNKTPYTIVVIAPEQGKKLADELIKYNFDIKWVLFDISNELIKNNLINDGHSIKDIDKRFNREDNVRKFIEIGLKEDFLINDEILNNQLSRTFINNLNKGRNSV